MKKILLLVLAMLTCGMTSVWADSETTYYPTLDVNFRTSSAENNAWNSGFPKDASAEGNTEFELTYAAGFFSLQKFTIADLDKVTKLVLTLTTGSKSGVDALEIWSIANTTWDATVNATDMASIVANTVGIAPRATEGTANTPLAKGVKVANSNPAKATFTFSGDALTTIKNNASAGSFTLLITNNAYTNGNSKRSYLSNNSANAEANRPTLVATIETPAVTNTTTGQSYSSLNDAVTAATGTNTLVVNKDIELTARVDVPANAELTIVPATDGITIKRASGNKGNILILPAAGCTLNLGTADKQLVIDGQSVEATAVAVEASQGTVTLTNILFKNCTTTNNQGIVCRKGNNTSLTLDGCTFDNCTVPMGRGALFIGKTGTILKGNNTFSNCTGNVYIESTYSLIAAEATHTTPISLIVADSRGEGRIVEKGDATKYTLVSSDETLTLTQNGDDVYISKVSDGIVGLNADADFSASESKIYDLQGRRVTGQMGKGIYIVNGKKVVNLR